LDQVWRATNLSSVLASHPKAAGDLSGVIASDGTPRVAFRSVGGGVREIYLDGASKWSDGFNMGGGASAEDAAASDPVGFKGADGKAAFVYRNGNDQLRLWSVETGTPKWVAASLPTLTGAEVVTGRPLPLVTADGITRLLYRATSGRIRQIARRQDGAWEKADLSEMVDLKGWRADSDPIGYATLPDK
jgi:hypothetical protein